MCSRIIPTSLFFVNFLLKGSIYVLLLDCPTITLLRLWYLSNRDYWELFSICRSCKNKNRRKFEARKKFYLTEFGKISISWLNVSLWYPPPFIFRPSNIKTPILYLKYTCLVCAYSFSYCSINLFFYVETMCIYITRYKILLYNI